MGLGWCFVVGGVVTALLLDKQALGVTLGACGGLIVVVTPVAVGMRTAFFGANEHDTAPGT